MLYLVLIFVKIQKNKMAATVDSSKHPVSTHLVEKYYTYHHQICFPTYRNVHVVLGIDFRENPKKQDGRHGRFVKTSSVHPFG